MGLRDKARKAREKMKEKKKTSEYLVEKDWMREYLMSFKIEERTSALTHIESIDYLLSALKQKSPEYGDIDAFIHKRIQKKVDLSHLKLIKESLRDLLKKEAKRAELSKK